MSSRRGKRSNGKSKKQPKVGRMACRGHSNKYANFSKHKHNAYGIQE